MLDLCFKDFRASLFIWILILVAYFLYGLNPLPPGVIFLGLGTMLFLGLFSVPLILEDHFRTAQLFSSLPLRRSTIVGARYLMAVLVLAASMLLSVIYMLGFRRMIRGFFPGMIPAISPEWVAFFFGFGLLCVAVLLPLYYRFGILKSILPFFPGVVILAAILYSWSMLFLIGANGGIHVSFHAFFRSPFSACDTLFRAMIRIHGVPWTLAILGGGVILLLWISWSLSLRAFKSQEL